jgi:hypothetical protein
VLGKPLFDPSWPSNLELLDFGVERRPTCALFGQGGVAAHLFHVSERTGHARYPTSIQSAQESLFCPVFVLAGTRRQRGSALSPGKPVTGHRPADRQGPVRQRLFFLPGILANSDQMWQKRFSRDALSGFPSCMCPVTQYKWEMVDCGATWCNIGD